MKKQLLTLFMFSTLILSGCSYVNGAYVFDPFGKYANTSTGNATYETVTPNTNLTLRTINENAYGWHTSLTTGDQKILVIPVQLRQASRSATLVPTWNNEMLSNLNKAFFGTSDETNYESVASYYEKSSYNKLRFTGEVSDVFQSQYYADSGRKGDPYSLANYGEESADKIIDEYYETCDQDLLKSYDLDNDGFVDNAVFIYSNDASASTSSAFWAWTYYHDTVTKENKTLINNYMWASYSFLDEEYADGYNSDKVDAHTYIHETGHLLGLDDYYNSDGGWDPAGELEMQSYNVGDQSIFSKIALGWCDVKYATSSGDITLNTSASNGDCILIKNDWNKSIFDEYLLVEYYTPTGLNETDANHQFSDRNKMYSESGLRIYHVDTRLVNLKSISTTGGEAYEAVSYVDDVNNLDSSYEQYVASSNTPTRSYLDSTYASKFVYLHLLDEGGNNGISSRNPYIDVNNTIWTGSKTFTPNSTFFYNKKSSWSSSSLFNDESAISYSISVKDLTDTSCIVTLNSL